MRKNAKKVLQGARVLIEKVDDCPGFMITDYATLQKMVEKDPLLKAIYEDRIALLTADVQRMREALAGMIQPRHEAGKD